MKENLGGSNVHADALRVATLSGSAPNAAVSSNSIYFNVRDYGGVGDGTTDDTVAIQAAINAAELVSGMVVFPAGDYLVAGNGTELLLVRGQIELIGFGWGSKIIVDSTVGATVDVIHVYGPSEGLRIEGLKIVPESGTPARHAINLDATSTYEGERPISKFVIAHNWLGQFGGRGIVTTFPAPYFNGVFNGVIRENTIYGGIYLNRAGDLLAIRDNTLTGTGPGIECNLIDGEIAASQLVIDHNSIVSKDGSIVVVAGQRVHITNNNIEPAAGSTPGANDALVDLQGSEDYPLEGITIHDNLFSCTPDTATDHIRADWVKGLNIQGNTFGYGKAGQHGIHTTANCDDVWVGPNVHKAYDNALSLMLDTAGPNVMTYLPRYGTHRIGPILNVINDTQADEQTVLIVTASATQSGDLMLVQDEAGNPLFRINVAGGIVLSANRQINVVDSGGNIVPVFDGTAIDDTCRVGFITAPPTNGHLRFYAAGAEKVRIVPAGNLLIGTTTDSMTASGSLAIAKDLAHRGTLVGLNGAPPVAQSTGWAVTAGYTADKAFDPETAGVQEVARALGTLIDYLKSRGDLGA